MCISGSQLTQGGSNTGVLVASGLYISHRCCLVSTIQGDSIARADLGSMYHARYLHVAKFSEAIYLHVEMHELDPIDSGFTSRALSNRIF